MNSFLVEAIMTVIVVFILISILVYIEYHDRVCDKYIRNNSKYTDEWLSDIAEDITNSEKLK